VAFTATSPLSMSAPHFLPDHSHTFLSFFWNKKKTEIKSEEVTLSTKKNVFLLFSLKNQYSLRSSVGLQKCGNAMRRSSKQEQPLRQAGTFFGDCLACRYAWMSVTEWEWRHLIYSQALWPAGQQQQRHYGQTLASLSAL